MPFEIFHKIPMVSDIKQAKFLHYFIKQWLNDSLSIAVWNHHQTDKRRTNNDVEGFHSGLWKSNLNVHPRVDEIIQQIKLIDAKSRDILFIMNKFNFQIYAIQIQIKIYATIINESTIGDNGCVGTKAYCDTIRHLSKLFLMTSVSKFVHIFDSQEMQLAYSGDFIFPWQVKLFSAFMNQLFHLSWYYFFCLPNQLTSAGCNKFVKRAVIKTDSISYSFSLTWTDFVWWHLAEWMNNLTLAKLLDITYGTVEGTLL